MIELISTVFLLYASFCAGRVWQAHYHSEPNPNGWIGLLVLMLTGWAVVPWVWFLDKRQTE